MVICSNIVLKAQSVVDSAFRCSGLCWVRSWKLPWWELSGQPVPMLGQFVSFDPVGATHLLVWGCCFSSICHTSITRICILANFPVDTVRLLLRAPEPSCLQAEPGLILQLLLIGQVLQPNYFGGLHWTHSSLPTSFIYWEPKLAAVFKMWCNEYQIKMNNQFPWSTGSVFINKVRYDSTRCWRMFRHKHTLL